MLTIEKPRCVIGMDAGKIVAKLDLQASTAADLPALGDVVDSYKVAAGSIAQLIQAGYFVTLDDNGVWYRFGGSQPDADAGTEE